MTDPASLRLTSLVLAALVAALAAALVGPATPAAASTAVEPYATYQPQNSCDPHAKRGTTAFRSLILHRFGGADSGIVRPCAYGGGSEHKEGRAWDWGLNYRHQRDRARARAAIDWLTAPLRGETAARARRLGVMYMIWNKRIWSVYLADEGWRPYTGSAAHRDHLHFSLSWNGATRRVSWWTGRVMAFDYGPCQRWIGEYAHPWHGPRTTPCPPAIHRPKAVRGVYRVQYGDTVARVARYFDLSRTQVRRWNEFTGTVTLQVGQRVRVSRPPTVHTNLATLRSSS